MFYPDGVCINIVLSSFILYDAHMYMYNAHTVLTGENRTQKKDVVHLLMGTVIQEV